MAGVSSSAVDVLLFSTSLEVLSIISSNCTSGCFGIGFSLLFLLGESEADEPVGSLSDSKFSEGLRDRAPDGKDLVSLAIGGGF